MVHVAPSGEAMTPFGLIATNRVPSYTTRSRDSVVPEFRVDQVTPSVDVTTSPLLPTPTKRPAP